MLLAVSQQIQAIQEALKEQAHQTSVYIMFGFLKMGMY